MRCPFWQLHFWKLCSNAMLPKVVHQKFPHLGNFRLPILANWKFQIFDWLSSFHSWKLVVANFGIHQCFQKWQLPASSSKFPNLATFDLPKTCHIWLQNIAQYKLASDEVGLRVAAYNTFCTLWRELAPHITVMKPMTDLCWVCQQNSTAMLRAANRPVEEKSEVIPTLHYCTLTCMLKIRSSRMLRNTCWPLQRH